MPIFISDSWNRETKLLAVLGWRFRKVNSWWKRIGQS